MNNGLERSSAAYGRVVGRMLARPLPWIAGFVLAVVATGLLYARLPGGFLPTEDQGYLFVAYNGAPGSTMQRTQQAIDQAEKVMKDRKSVV